MSSSLITCTNKGCYNQDYHKLDLDSDEVYCLNCKKTVAVNSYFKKTLKTTGQVFRKVDTGVKYSCAGCKVNDTPAILEFGRNIFEVVCAHCGKLNSHLTNFFLEPLKMNDSIPRIKAKVTVDKKNNETVVQADGNPLPWNDPQARGVRKAGTPITVAQTDAEIKAKRLADQRAAKKKRVEQDQAREQEAMIAAQAHAILLASERNLPKKLGSSRRAEPATAQDMLKRAGVKILDPVDDEEETEYEDAPKKLRPGKKRPVIKTNLSGKKTSTVKPLSAAEMLKKAGVKNLAEDADEEEDY